MKFYTFAVILGVGLGYAYLGCDAASAGITTTNAAYAESEVLEKLKSDPKPCQCSSRDMLCTCCLNVTLGRLNNYACATFQVINVDKSDLAKYSLDFNNLTKSRVLSLKHGSYRLCHKAVLGLRFCYGLAVDLTLTAVKFCIDFEIYYFSKLLHTFEVKCFSFSFINMKGKFIMPGSMTRFVFQSNTKSENNLGMGLLSQMGMRRSQNESSDATITSSTSTAPKGS